MLTNLAVSKESIEFVTGFIVKFQAHFKNFTRYFCKNLHVKLIHFNVFGKLIFFLFEKKMEMESLEGAVYFLTGISEEFIVFF